MADAAPEWVYAATAARLAGVDRRRVMRAIAKRKIDVEIRLGDLQDRYLVRLDQVRAMRQSVPSVPSEP